METKSASSSSFWWLKGATTNPPLPTIPKLDLDISSSLADYLEKEQNALISSASPNTNNNSHHTTIDVGSIIEEINRVAAESPLGPYQPYASPARSIDDLMREAERIHLESSKSFEQLGQRSRRTSQNVTTDLTLDDDTSDATQTPKSVSPLPMDRDEGRRESYSEDFTQEDGDDDSKIDSILSSIIDNNNQNEVVRETVPQVEDDEEKVVMVTGEGDAGLIKTLEDDNKVLRNELKLIELDLQQTKQLFDETRIILAAKSHLSSSITPEINPVEYERIVEELKDSKEHNTSLQLQLDTVNKTHLLLKNSYEHQQLTNNTLERRLVELDATLSKYRNELNHIKGINDQLTKNEANTIKLLDSEKIQTKNLKLQNEKDAKCILDLNRQIKEMERIIARKHPDSVSALIVAAKTDVTDTNQTARKLLEDRIKLLEQEATNRDQQSTQVFYDIQEKFNQMKLKYENHIDDLELHVNDLKEQLKRRTNTYDVYTQTILSSSHNDHNSTGLMMIAPNKDDTVVSRSTQTNNNNNKNQRGAAGVKEETHLIATLKGLQIDLSNKEKVVLKLQRELDELKRTNRRLQKEREGSLRSLNETSKFRSYPEKLSAAAAAQLKLVSGVSSRTTTPVNNNNNNNDSIVSTVILEDELRLVKSERDKMKQQLYRIESDYQALKSKRLHDLNALQEAHEREIAAYISNINPLREQLELQQASVTTLENQLTMAKEELNVVLNKTNTNDTDKSPVGVIRTNDDNNFCTNCMVLRKKIDILEKRYDEREVRLSGIVHGLVTTRSTSTNRNNCEQCDERQKQLIEYKIELDQLLVAVRNLK